MKNIADEKIKKKFINMGLIVFTIILLMIDAFNSSGGRMLSCISIIITQVGLLLLAILEYLNYVNKKQVEQGLKTKDTNIDNSELKNKRKETIILISTIVLSVITMIFASSTSSEVEKLKNELYIIILLCALLFIITEHLYYVKKYREEQSQKAKQTKEEFDK